MSCRRCHAHVLQADVPRHLRQGCSNSPASGGTTGAAEHDSGRYSEAPSGVSVSASSLTVSDVNNALAELKEMLATSTTDQLAIFETKMNELAENMASLAAKILTAVERKEMTTELPQRRFQPPNVHRTDFSEDNISRESLSRNKSRDGNLLGSTSVVYLGAPLTLSSLQQEAQRVPGNLYYERRAQGTMTSGLDSTQTTSGRGAIQKDAAGNPAPFLIHSERKDIVRPSYDLTLSTWASFKKKASNTQSHVYATSTVWNGRELSFRVLLAFDSFDGNETYLNAYVKFYNPAVMLGQGASATSQPSLAILHSSNSLMALNGRPMKSPASRGGERDSHITSQGYVLYLSVQVIHLEEGGYVADNKVQFRLVVSDAPH